MGEKVGESPCRGNTAITPFSTGICMSYILSFYIYRQVEEIFPTKEFHATNGPVEDKDNEWLLEQLKQGLIQSYLLDSFSRAPCTHATSFYSSSHIK